MRSLNLILIAITFLILLLTLTLTVFSKQKEIKCQGFSQYNTVFDGKKYKYDLLESVFLFGKENALIFHGYMEYENKKLQIERKVTLSGPEIIDARTLLIEIISTDKTTNDEITNDNFSHLLSNIGFIGKKMRLDINRIYNDSFLLGNSTSYNFICTPYY